MAWVHLGQAAHAPPVYRMVPPYNFEKLHLPHLLTPVPVRLEAAAGYRLPGVRGWGHFRGSKRPQVGPVQRIVLTRMPNAIPPMVEQRILALALAYPGWGPDRLSLELGREKWGGLKVSANGVWRVLKRHGLNTRANRLSLVCGYAAPPQPERPEPPPERHIEVQHPGHRVQFDNFYIGRLAGTEGVIWQDSACDVASSYTLAELHVTPKNPSAHWTSALAQRVAQDLSERGWQLEAAMTDNASEYRAQEFNHTLAQLGVKHIYIRAGRPTSNGCVERVQQTLLEESWKPAFARYLTPKYTGLQRDLVRG